MSDHPLSERKEALRRSLTNHRPDAGGIETIEAIRALALSLGEFIIDEVPAGREQALALTHLEETTMWACKAIALESGTPSPLGG